MSHLTDKWHGGRGVSASGVFVFWAARRCHTFYLRRSYIIWTKRSILLSAHTHTLCVAKGEAKDRSRCVPNANYQVPTLHASDTPHARAHIF